MSGDIICPHFFLVKYRQKYVIQYNNTRIELNN